METRGSRRKVSIEIETPNIMGAPFSRVPVTEKIVSSGHVCNYCNGQGEVMHEDSESHEWEYKECPVCKGAGEMAAVITIEWQPSVIKNQE